jgi:hypothetical protein
VIPPLVIHMNSPPYLLSLYLPRLRGGPTRKAHPWVCDLAGFLRLLEGAQVLVHLLPWLSAGELRGLGTEHTAIRVLHFQADLRS